MTMLRHRLHQPATIALEKQMECLPAPEAAKRRRRNCGSPEQSNQSSSKRSRKSLEDMTDIRSTINSVQESMAFPSIEWAFNDDDEASFHFRAKSCSQFCSAEPVEQRSSSCTIGKRDRRNGLLRSQSRVTSLVSLVNTSTRSCLNDDCHDSTHSNPVFILSDQRFAGAEVLDMTLSALLV